jgi:2,3-bisphosphoglycerate-dependent phosphoglycerate mutase
MKKSAFLLSLLFFAAISLYAQHEITTFILVRHGEKMADTDDPDLKAEGYDRAKRLAQMLKNTSLNAVLSTKYKRTKNTVTPTADDKHLEIELYDKMTAVELDALISKYKGGTILIGGHSNTIPQIANLLIGKDEFKNFPDAEFGNLLIISVVERGKNAKVTWLSY